MVTSDWSRLMRDLGPRFAERASVHDANDSFVAENFAELRALGVFAAGVPKELGGGDASYTDLASMLRTLALYCSSTALALSMHTHVVAAAAWRWRRDPDRQSTCFGASPMKTLLWYPAAARLADGLGNGDARRRRLEHQRAKGFRQRGFLPGTY